MRITYLDVTSEESGFEPPLSQMSSMENRILGIFHGKFGAFYPPRKASGDTDSRHPDFIDPYRW